MKRLIVDRFEGEIAVCETEEKRFMDIPAAELPKNIHEGDCLRVMDDGEITIDVEETRKRREHVIDLMKQVFDE